MEQLRFDARIGERLPRGVPNVRQNAPCPVQATSSSWCRCCPVSRQRISVVSQCETCAGGSLLVRSARAGLRGARVDQPHDHLCIAQGVGSRRPPSRATSVAFCGGGRSCSARSRAPAQPRGSASRTAKSHSTWTRSDFTLRTVSLWNATQASPASTSSLVTVLMDAPVDAANRPQGRTLHKQVDDGSRAWQLTACSCSR